MKYVFFVVFVGGGVNNFEEEYDRLFGTVKAPLNGQRNARERATQRNFMITKNVNSKVLLFGSRSRSWFLFRSSFCEYCDLYRRRQQRIESVSCIVYRASVYPLVL